MKIPNRILMEMTPDEWDYLGRPQPYDPIKMVELTFTRQKKLNKTPGNRNTTKKEGTTYEN